VNRLVQQALTVTDSNGLSDTTTSQVTVTAANVPPSANIESNTASGNAPLAVNFNGAASSAVGPATITSYLWEFGNGESATSANASTTYTAAGTYIVSLTVTDSNGLSDSAMLPIVVDEAAQPPVVSVDAERAAAARLLAQATFGATTEDIDEVVRVGVEAWVDSQFSRQGGSHLEYVQNHPGSGSLSGPRQHKWLIDAIDGDDQLRQRVAFAYSEIFVTSDLSQTLDREQYAMTNYYDILLNNAFSNYRVLLEEVTLSPIIGLYELNQDGSIRRDFNGDPLPAYTQQDVEEYARVFTGWSYAGTDRFDHEPADRNTNKFLPMEPFPGFHDLGSKNLLRGAVSPAGISAEEDLSNALDSLFNHPNVAPFIGEQLIKRLVTSNPTRAYVGRVAAAFNNNGSGVRGDMQAVIRAILLDEEAREGYSNVPNYGKLREPLIRWTHLWRAFDVQRGRNSSNDKYNHSSPRDAGLVAPEAEIYTDAYILTTTAKISGLAHVFYQGADPRYSTLDSSYIDITEETELAADPNALIARLNLVLMSGQMSPAMQAVLFNHMNSLPSDEAGRSLRVRDGITLIMASPQYLVQK